MLKSELNAYLGVLKAIAKSNHLDTLKGIAVNDGNLEATNLDITAVLKSDIKAETAIYNSQILDLLKAVPTADLAPYKAQPIEDWVEARPQEFGEEINLDTRHPRGTLGEIIAHAFGFVSTDTTRPALMCVWSDKGEITATDGYRAYASGPLAELEDQTFSLTTEVMKHLKKLIKYKGFKLRYGDQTIEIENEHFKLRAPLCSKSPAPVRDLMNSNRKFGFKVVLPYKQLKPLFSKTTKELEIRQDGALILDNRPLPIKAEVKQTDDYEYDLDHCHALLCGLSNGGTRMNPNLLSAYTTDKDGNLNIRVNFGERDHLYGVDEPM